LPMAYGDSAASLVGERFGRRRYKLVAVKSLEGSAAMFLASFSSFTLSLFFFSTLYPFSVLGKILSALALVWWALWLKVFRPWVSIT